MVSRPAFSQQFMASLTSEEASASFMECALVGTLTLVIVLLVLLALAS